MKHYERHNGRSVERRFAWPFAFAVSLIALASLASGAGAAPYRPSDDGEILARSFLQDPRVSSALREAQAALKRHPENLALALNVARQYITLGRNEGDPRYYGYAQAALSPWWSLSEPPLDVLVLRAVLHQADHHFDRALGDLDLVLQLNPKQAQAWLSRAVILQVQGRFAEAANSCRQIKGRVAAIVVATCLSAANSLTGEAEDSYRLLSDAISATPKIDPQLRVWSLTVLGEIAARQGRLSLAEEHFRDALTSSVRSTYLLAAFADLLLDQARFAEVRDLLKDETRADPLLLRLVLAEMALDSKTASANRDDLRLRFAAGRRRGDTRHLREEARFMLDVMDRPTEALRLALENWRAQREPWDTRLVLAAALKTGNSIAAEEVLRWLADTGIQDAQIDKLVSQFRKEGS